MYQVVVTKADGSKMRYTDQCQHDIWKLLVDADIQLDTMIIKSRPQHPTRHDDNQVNHPLL